MKPTIIIGDNDEFGAECAFELSKLGFEALALPADGPGLLEAIMLKQPRAIILQPWLTGYDIPELVNRIRRRGFSPKVIVAATQQENFLSGKVMEQSIDYYFVRPFSYGVLASRILELLGQGEFVCERVKTPETRLELLVSEILLQLGIPASQKGYRYLRTAILKSYFDSGVLESITGTLYPEIAKEHSSTAVRVERAIRHSIETAWQRASLEALGEYFGNNLQCRPTNSAFVATVSDRLRYKYKIAT